MQPTEVKAEGSKQGDKTLLGHTDSLVGTKLDYLKSAGLINWGTSQEVTKRDLDAIERAVKSSRWTLQSRWKEHYIQGAQ